MERGLQEEQELRVRAEFVIPVDIQVETWSGWLDYEPGVWGKRDRGGGGGSCQ